MDGFRLGVDFGASHTVAMLSWPDGRVSPLLFDGSPLLPSAVYADPTGLLLTGQDAVHAGRARPEGLEPHPKRRIDAGSVSLGGIDVPVTTLVAAVLGRVGVEAFRVARVPIVHTVLSCPASWTQPQRDTLHAAAAAVFGQVELVPEPVAAASHLLPAGTGPVPVGGYVGVYDLGAGTFEASVLRRTGYGFEVLGSTALADAGGLAIDAAIVAHLGGIFAARDAATWQRLAAPASAADLRASRQLWDDVRTGKEMLSRTGATTLHVPLFDEDITLDRGQLDQLSAPVLDRTTAATRAMLHAAGVPVTYLAGLFPVGGGSRQPLVAATLHRALGVAPAIVDQPELAVADGSLRRHIASAPPRRRAGLAAVAAAGVVALAGAVVAVVGVAGPGGGTGVPQAVVANESQPASAAGSPGQNPPPSATPRSSTPSPTVSSVADPCLLGTWTLTSAVRDHQIDGITVRTSSDGGAVSYLRPDGTFLNDLDQGYREVATVNGHRYEIVATGIITGSYRTSGDLLLWSDNHADGEIILRIDGVERVREPARPVTEPARYVCAEESLHVYYQMQGAFEYERTSTDWAD